MSNDIRTLINSPAMMEQIARALPKHITADRMIRVMLTTMSKVPKLADCTKESLLGALMDCSAMGIEPDGRKAHLIPYGKTCQLIIDYKGLVELARRSGQIDDIHADVVCENDEFSFCYGTGSHLKHSPKLAGRGNPVAAYSYVRLKDGSESFEVLNVEEVEKVRNASKAGKSGPWVDHWQEMAKKTAFRRHSKWLPLSVEFQEALERDQDVPDFERDVQTGTAPYKQNKGAEALLERLSVPEEEPTPEEPETNDQPEEELAYTDS